MIQPLTGESSTIKQVEDVPVVVGLESKLMAENPPEERPSVIDGLYEALKEKWKNEPEFDSADVINYLSNYENTDGTKPYKGIQTHVSVIAQIMERLKKEGEEKSIIYALMNKSLGYAVVSNGVLVDFISKMLIRSEPPEPW